MNYLKKIFTFIILILTLVLLYFQITIWQNQVVGLLLVTCYLLLVGNWWQNIFKKVFGLNKKSLVTKIYSWFTVFLLLGLFASVCVVFNRLTPIIVWGCYATTIILTLCIWFIVRKLQVIQSQETGKLSPPQRDPASRRWRNLETNNDLLVLFNKKLFSNIFIIVYLFLWFIAFYLLYNSQSLAPLNSPWQTINQYFLPLFFVLTIILGIQIFSKHKTSTILFLIILHSFLLHAYLPLSHQLPWGGDVWRHIAIENKIASGEQILPVLVGADATWRETISINLPEVFFNASKYSYGHLWGTTVLLFKTFGVSLMTLNKWLVPIVFSIVLPILLFRIGKIIFEDKRKALVLSALSFLPFALQAQGSLTLPVSFGLLLFLFVLSLWLQYLRDGVKAQRNLVLFFALLIGFGYGLYFILIWVVIGFSTLIKILEYRIWNIEYKTKKSFNILYSISFKIFLFLLSILIIPAIELISKVSHLPQNFNIWQNLKQMVGQLSGWFYASAIRPHDILSGNIIFNHTPDYAFVISIFNSWRWWLIPAMLVLWMLVAFGFYRMIKASVTCYVLRVIYLLFSTVFGGYLIGWFVLEGDRLLTRRLDGILAVLILILMVQGFSWLKFQISNFKFQILAVIVITFFSWFTIFTYASGPDMRVVSVDEYNVAKYIWNNSQPITYNLKPETCVLADTWVLLPLEALSSRQIIGGGFPIDNNFGQTELTDLYSQMTVQPSQDLLNRSHQLTGAEKCWLVSGVQTRLPTPGTGGQEGSEFLVQSNRIFNSEPVKIGSLLVWETTSATSTVEIKGLKNVKK